MKTHRSRPPSIPLRTRNAITLVETLAATVLMVLLLTALNGVLRGLHEQRTLALEQPSPDWLRRLACRLEFDVRNARRMSVSENRLTLVGFSGRDPATGVALHTRTQVVYEVIPVQNILIRQERSLEPASANPLRKAELMGAPVNELLVGRWDDRLTDMRIPIPDQQTLHAVPQGLRIVVLNSGAILCDTTVLKGGRR